MPNGYSEVMRVITKTLKPPFAKLRNQGHLFVTFLDDSYSQGNTLTRLLKFELHCLFAAIT